MAGASEARALSDHRPAGARLAACRGIAPALRGGALVLMIAGCALLCAPEARAQDDDPAAVLELRFIPAPRAQIAIWIEDEGGRFIRTLGLTEAVAYRGIGNRPGASQMNSGFRWPYGRREGALPIWAHRRAGAPNAQKFQRVIFQSRISEGHASRSVLDQSPDTYFCLSFNQATTTRDALDAVSCASVFTSDKGRFMDADDVDARYAEPWQEPGSRSGTMAALPIDSLYPPRMDVDPCTARTENCYDHVDTEQFASHVRAVMPEIDEVTMATPPGTVQQSLLFNVPSSWPAGVYTLWIEVNVEGDYNDSFNDVTMPTPSEPSDRWDSWAEMYGYAYRGQPSIAYKISFEHRDVGEATYATDTPVGRSSWDFWSDDFGDLQSLSGMSDDPDGAPGSGVDRLMQNEGGERLWLAVNTLVTPPERDPEGEDPFAMPPPTSEPDPPGGEPDPDGEGSEPGGEPPDPDPEGMTPGAEDPTQPDPEQPLASDDGVIVGGGDEGSEQRIGAVQELKLGRHPDLLHSHEWITLRFRAPKSEAPLHHYDVRISTERITDAASFIRNGRPAKTATLDAEGAVSLMLDPKVKPGKVIESEIGDLAAETQYYVAVRATDQLNRTGPIRVAQIKTTERTFATVTPCFVATAAYGAPLASEVGVLRRVRDRFLLPNAAGRMLVDAYYAQGAAWAERLQAYPTLRGLVRALLTPIVGLARVLP